MSSGDSGKTVVHAVPLDLVYLALLAKRLGHKLETKEFLRGPPVENFENVGVQVILCSRFDGATAFYVFRPFFVMRGGPFCAGSVRSALAAKAAREVYCDKAA